MIKTLGLILKKQNIGETDRIITVFSPTLGKKRVVARAVRRTTSKLAGHLDTFMLSQLMLTDELELPKVTSAVLIESFEGLRDSLPRLKRAFAISKIIERVILEDINQQAIFQLTLDALARLNDDQSWRAVWLTFLSVLTDQLGLHVSEFSCSQCHEPIRNACFWLPNDRLFSCQNCGSTATESIKLSASSVKLLQLLKKKSYPLIRQIKIPLPVASEIEELFLREITQWFNKPWSAYSSMNGDN